MDEKQIEKQIEKGSVSQHLSALRIGDSLAQQRLWDRYMERLVKLASRKLRGAHGLDAGAEDAVIQAYHEFLDGVPDGRFSKLQDRDDLWQVLVMLTNRRSTDILRKAGARKRGSGKVSVQSNLTSSTPSSDFEQVVSGEPSPEFAALMNEEVIERLSELDSEELRTIALQRMKGYGNEEIAKSLGKALRTIERKVGIIRDQWAKHL